MPYSLQPDIRNKNIESTFKANNSNIAPWQLSRLTGWFFLAPLTGYAITTTVFAAYYQLH